MSALARYRSALRDGRFEAADAIFRAMSDAEKLELEGFVLNPKETPMPEAQPTTTLAPVPAPLPLCDAAGCSAFADFSYIFDWGQRGHCCHQHKIVVQQTANNTERGVQFAAISSGATPPVERAERIMLKSEAYAAQADATDARERGRALYTQNQQLATQVEALRARERHLTAELKVASETNEQLKKDLQASDAEATQLFDEVSRLRVLVGEPPSGEDPTEISGGKLLTDAQRIAAGLAPLGQQPPKTEAEEPKGKGKGKG